MVIAANNTHIMHQNHMSDDPDGTTPSTPTSSSVTVAAAIVTDKGTLLKRKDYLGLDMQANSHPNRTYYYKKTYDDEEIIESTTRNLVVDVTDIQSLHARGSAYYRKQLYHACIDDLSQVIAMDPLHIDSLYCRGMAHSKVDKLDAAIDDFTVALGIDSNHVNAAFARAACYNSLGQFSRAIEDYNVALMMVCLLPVS